MKTRTHGARVKAEHERAHLSPEQIRAAKCTRTKARSQARLADRRAAAEDRQVNRDKLSNAQQIAVCKSRRGHSKKEIARLEKI